MTIHVISNECERSFSRFIFEGGKKLAKLNLLTPRAVRFAIPPFSKINFVPFGLRGEISLDALPHWRFCG